MNDERLPDVQGWDLVKILTKYYGYTFRRQKGSHVKLLHKITNTTLIVPCKKGKSLKKGTLRGILRDGDIGITDFRSKT